MKSPLLAAPAVLLLLTACTTTSPTPAGGPEPSGSTLTLEVGACLADYDGPDSDRTSLVECTEEHTFDVFEIATWPEMEVELAASDPGELYDELMADETTPRADDYWAWAYDHCFLAMDAYIGLDDVVVGDLTQSELLLQPGGLWDVDYSLASREAFAAGDTATVCSFVWFTPEGESRTVAHAEGITPATMLSNFTPELQGCFTRDPEASNDLKYVTTDCTTPHNGQYLLYADGLAALGADYMATVDPNNTVFQDYAPLDAFCSDAIEAVYPGLLDSSTWRVWSDQVSNWQGWDGYDGTIDPEQIYPVYCAILTTTDGTTIVGDVISGDVTMSVELG